MEFPTYVSTNIIRRRINDDFLERYLTSSSLRRKDRPPSRRRRIWEVWNVVRDLVHLSGEQVLHFYQYRPRLFYSRSNFFLFKDVAIVTRMISRYLIASTCVLALFYLLLLSILHTRLLENTTTFIIDCESISFATVYNFIRHPFVVVLLNHQVIISYCLCDSVFFNHPVVIRVFL